MFVHCFSFFSYINLSVWSLVLTLLWYKMLYIYFKKIFCDRKRFVFTPALYSSVIETYLFDHYFLICTCVCFCVNLSPGRAVWPNNEVVLWASVSDCSILIICLLSITLYISLLPHNFFYLFLDCSFRFYFPSDLSLIAAHLHPSMLLYQLISRSEELLMSW